MYLMLYGLGVSLAQCYMYIHMQIWVGQWVSTVDVIHKIQWNSWKDVISATMTTVTDKSKHHFLVIPTDHKSIKFSLLWWISSIYSTDLWLKLTTYFYCTSIYLNVQVWPGSCSFQPPTLAQHYKLQLDFNHSSCPMSHKLVGNLERDLMDVWKSYESMDSFVLVRGCTTHWLTQRMRVQITW